MEDLKKIAGCLYFIAKDEMSVAEVRIANILIAAGVGRWEESESGTIFQKNTT